MKFYRLEAIGGLTNSDFAFSMVTDFIDAYKPNSLSWWRWGTECPQCGTSCWTLIEPLQMKWWEGSEQIGDFACSCPILAQHKVVDFFHKNDFFIKYTDVEFIPVPPPSPKSRKPKYPIVFSTPYVGPEFFGVFPKYGVHLNDEKSDLFRKSNCSLCGDVRYDLFRKANPWEDLVIDEEEWNGLKLFGLFELDNLLFPSQSIYLSEEGHDLLMKQGFTNVKCVERGRIEKAGHGKMKPYREQADYDFWKPDEYIPLPPKEPKKRRKK